MTTDAEKKKRLQVPGQTAGLGVRAFTEDEDGPRNRPDTRDSSGAPLRYDSTGKAMKANEGKDEPTEASKGPVRSNLLNRGTNGRATQSNTTPYSGFRDGTAKAAVNRTDDDQPSNKIGGSVRKIGGVARDKIGGTAHDKIGGIVKRIGGTAADKIDGVVKKKASEARRRKIAEYGE